MNIKTMLKYAVLGAIVYGAYKFGENQAKDNEPKTEPQPKPETQEKSEIDYIRDIIDILQNKPNKTKKDKDTLELLGIKLQQLLKEK